MEDPFQGRCKVASGLINYAMINLSGFLFLMLCAIVSCAPKAPIPVLEYGDMDASGNRNLLILLRGRGGSHKDFEKHGIELIIAK